MAYNWSRPSPYALPPPPPPPSYPSNAQNRWSNNWNTTQPALNNVSNNDSTQNQQWQGRKTNLEREDWVALKEMASERRREKEDAALRSHTETYRTMFDELKKNMESDVSKLQVQLSTAAQRMELLTAHLTSMPPAPPPPPSPQALLSGAVERKRRRQAKRVSSSTTSPSSDTSMSRAARRRHRIRQELADARALAQEAQAAKEKASELERALQLAKQQRVGLEKELQEARRRGPHVNTDLFGTQHGPLTRPRTAPVPAPDPLSGWTRPPVPGSRRDVQRDPSYSPTPSEGAHVRSLSPPSSDISGREVLRPATYATVLKTPPGTTTRTAGKGKSKRGVSTAKPAKGAGVSPSCPPQLRTPQVLRSPLPLHSVDPGPGSSKPPTPWKKTDLLELGFEDLVKKLDELTSTSEAAFLKVCRAFFHAPGKEIPDDLLSLYTVLFPRDLDPPTLRSSMVERVTKKIRVECYHLQ